MNTLSASLIQRLPRRVFKIPKRYESRDLKYDLSEEIVTTTYKKIMILGINLPDTSNSLNNSALDKLNQKLKDFNEDDDFTVVVLHGIGANFCTGIQETADEKKAKEIIKTMSEIRKPSITSMSGYTTCFGFQLAIMSDFRVMEVNSVCGFGLGNKRGAIYPVVCKRLLSLTNLSSTLDFVLSGTAINQNIAVTLGIINRSVDSGTGLGKSLNMANSIAKFPLEEVLKHRDLIYSFMPRYTGEPY